MSNVLVPGKETVVQPRGESWSFHLPEHHTIDVDQANRFVTLHQPDAGSTFELQAIEERGNEVVVKLGDPMVRSSLGTRQPGYPLPQVQDEFDRLRVRWT